MSSKLRRPNFHTSLASLSTEVAGVGSSDDIESLEASSTTVARNDASTPLSLVNYTRQYYSQKRRLTSSTMLMTCMKTNNADDEENCRENDIVTAKSDRIIERATDAAPKNASTIDMDQSIALLEPILEIFQKNCILKENEKRKLQHQYNYGGSRIGDDKFNRMKNGVLQKDEKNDVQLVDDEAADYDDELPPQLLRAAKFFPHRFASMKRALFRFPSVGEYSRSKTNSSHASLSSSSYDDDSANVIELSVHYRLRLARACWKRGLAAAAEYEVLENSFNTMGREKRRRIVENDGGTLLENMKNCMDRNPIERNEIGEKCCKYENEESTSLFERVRLSFLRLPTDATHPRRSMMAWNYVEDILSQCNALWENSIRKQDDDDEDEAKKYLSDVVRRTDTKSCSITPDQVADWAMTSWTAVLLLRGLECTTIEPLEPSNQRDCSIGCIEKQLAVLLTDRSSPSAHLARAVEHRINVLLRPENIQSLNGLHLYSLGRLMASFHTRGDAIQHIVASICQCVLSGKDGTTGMDPLARLVAVFFCCLSSSSSLPLFANHGTRASSVVKDVEATLRVKLEADIVVNVMDDITNVDNDVDELSHDEDRRVVREKAKTYLDAVLSIAAHFIKCCEFIK